jgi:hypothetical protein
MLSNFNCITLHFYSSIINHQQMHLRIIKKEYIELFNYSQVHLLVIYYNVK